MSTKLETRETEEPLFDWSLYGALIRHARGKMGFKNTAMFSDGIYRRTRVRISKDVLYRIEQNRQEPTAMQFIAINLALFNRIWPGYGRRHDQLVPCLSRDWRHIESEEETPDEWKGMSKYDAKLMDKPSIGDTKCPVNECTCAFCHRQAMSRHHIVPKSHGGHKGPTVNVCGTGNNDGCHGLLHHHKLHLRFTDKWEYLHTEKPTTYRDALKMEGWRPVK